MAHSDKIQKQIGVISDTHGLTRPEVLNLFKGVDLILHAGDIGTAEVLEELRSIAPVIAVRGNNDLGGWAEKILPSETAQVGSVTIYILHDLKEIGRRPPPDVQVVISGHSHRPLIEKLDGVLFLNPGSAGPRRFSLPVSVALLTIKGSAVDGALIDLFPS